MGVWFGTLKEDSNVAGVNGKIVLKWTLNKMERSLPDTSGLG
jgi:hypothetical protein